MAFWAHCNGPSPPLLEQVRIQEPGYVGVPVDKTHPRDRLISGVELRIGTLLLPLPFSLSSPGPLDAFFSSFCKQRQMPAPPRLSPLDATPTAELLPGDDPFRRATLPTTLPPHEPPREREARATSSVEALPPLNNADKAMGQEGADDEMTMVMMRNIITGGASRVVSLHAGVSGNRGIDDEVLRIAVFSDIAKITPISHTHISHAHMFSGGCSS